MSSDRGLTTSEYAAHRGVSDSYVRRLRREGRLVLVGTSHRIDATASDARLEADGDAIRGGKHDGAADSAGAAPVLTPVGSVSSVREGQRQKLEQEIERLKRDNLESAKRTASRAVVERAMFTLARQTLGRLRALPARLRTQLAAESDARACEAMLVEEIEKVCEDLQREAKSLGESRFGLDAGSA